MTHPHSTPASEGQKETTMEAPECDYCVDGVQSDGETPCPCRAAAPQAAIDTLTADREALVKRALEEAARTMHEKWEDVDTPADILAALASDPAAMARIMGAGK